MEGWGQGGGGGTTSNATPSPPGCLRFKTGSAESDFNVSLIVRGKVTRQCPQTTTFEKGSEPKRKNVTECRISLPASGKAGSVYQYPVVPHQFTNIR